MKRVYNQRKVINDRQIAIMNSISNDTNSLEHLPFNMFLLTILYVLMIVIAKSKKTFDVSNGCLLGKNNLFRDVGNLSIEV